MDKCENTNLTIITNLIRIGNCIDTNVYVAGLRQPIIYGDSRSIILAPHNANYKKINLHLRKLGYNNNINTTNTFKKPILFMQSVDSNQTQYTYKSRHPREFAPMILPEVISGVENGTRIDKIAEKLPLAPPEYNKALYLRKSIFNSWQKNLHEKLPDQEQSIQLQLAIQG